MYSFQYFSQSTLPSSSLKVALILKCGALGHNKKSIGLLGLFWDVQEADCGTQWQLWFLVTMSLSVLCTSSGSCIIVEDTFRHAHHSGMDTFICFCCGDCRGVVCSGTESCSVWVTSFVQSFLPDVIWLTSYGRKNEMSQCCMTDESDVLHH